MFSSRSQWDLRPNALARVLSDKQRSAVPILDLTESNPTRAGLNYPHQEILDSLAQPELLLYEPSAPGLPVARNAVAKYYSLRRIPLDARYIQLTASTSEAYAFLFKLLAEPGDAFLAPRPSYPLFEYLSAFESARIVTYPLRYHGCWSLDVDALVAGIQPGVRAIVLVNPNNPTGSFLKRNELEALLSLCEKHGLAIISDEVFSDYAFAPDDNRVSSVAGMDRVLTFCLSGLSKLAGLPQLKLGWIAVAGPPALKETARERLELIADTYLSVATPVQHALSRLLAVGEQMRGQIQNRVRDNLRVLRSAIGSSSPCNLLSVEGGWYAILQVPRTRSEEEWCIELLKNDNVLVQPGYFYDFEQEAYLIVSLLSKPDDLAEGIHRLLARAGSL
jgi:aspartate/methionine/tyrosine aminotransferase